MKYIVLILMLVSCQVYGQVPDTSGKPHVLLEDETFVINGAYAVDTMATPRATYDTIPCIYLLCDTARTFSIWAEFKVDSTATRKYELAHPGIIYDGLIGKEVNDTTFYAPNQSVYWQRGFVRREKHNSRENKNPDSFCGNCPPDHDYWEGVEYLDINRKPFPANIVIWMKK